MDIDMPKINTVVNATIEHWHTKGKRQAELIHVKEDDVSWRTADDNSELSYDWNVVAWVYKSV
jgi:hypothetical protein